MTYAVQAREPGGPDVLEVAEIEAPRPGPGQLAVDVAAAGVNFIETYQRAGVYPVSYPFVPGSEAAGRVTAVGDGVSGFAVGDRVATAEGSATYASAMLLDAERAVRVPDEVPDDVAAAVPLQGFTAHYLVNSSYDVAEGDVVLTYAGAGGVGGILTQLLKLRGATVITTTSTPEKAALAREAGADHVVGYDDVAATVDEVTGGRGVDAVYDGVGKDTFDGSLAALKKRGTLVLFGGASGQVPPVDLQRLNAAGSVSVTRPKLADFLLTPEERAWRGGEIYGLVAGGQLTIRVGGSYPLAEAARAHADLESRATTGKLLLIP
ncbi:quinone oxidoreductase family protein [Zhihengliuella salsuginis]|uniref:Quinone oxidoreductase n=1 Tax=Zhihengliuella salsuginis TaxID=578222 RepID=A0ABQ3GJF0_9MICC|nr:quinone oxidoreductase [Zhihengliuella salsuginis]GHD07127.1 quinone oxidoreductase [Zhihengliuella salsuginis]